jgi:nucleotide-binding universal stress UspA family protein
LTAATQVKTSDGKTVFDRILVGIDGSEESREAARQAAKLAQGKLTLFAVYDTSDPIIRGTGTDVSPDYDEDHQRRAAERALEEAREEVASANPTGKVVRGVVWDALIDEIERERDTLIAVGSHGVGRVTGIAIGSAATEVIHKAPCSVLVGRNAGDDFPRRIIVGIDGSSESAAAYGAAQEIAKRFESELWPVVAHGGKPIDRSKIDSFVDHRCEDLADDPVTALVAAAAEADLLVVGSRGLHGIKALGSVSERVAHQARCSVLIVRAPA